MAKADVISMVAGLDIGNGYVKGKVLIDGETKPSGIDFLSGVALQTNAHDVKTKDAEAEGIIAHIFDEMESVFDSPVVTRQVVRLFGERAIRSGKSMEEFDVSSTESKANQDLSGILVLGSIAGKALQHYYDTTKQIPNDILKVHANLALALPITEYKSYRKSYAARFCDGTHIVSIRNFDTTIRVEIKIENVQVVAEGASAQYAIVAQGMPLMNAMLQDLKNHGEELPGVTAADVLAAENTVGIDIGEGTVNFPVFQNGRFNPDASMTFSKGYGTVLEQARERLREMNMPFNSRKALAAFLLQRTNPLNKARHEKVWSVVQEEIQGFAAEVIQEFRRCISRVGSYTEVVYVYGGGATPVKNELYPLLIGVAKSLGGEDVAYPVLYLDSQYSRHLNREGLYLIAKQTADCLRTAATTQADAKSK